MRAHIGLLVFCLVAPSLRAATDPADPGWPRRIKTDAVTIDVYQPQFDSFEGDNIEARAAVSIKMKDQKGAPVFGAVWLSARVETDRDARLVQVVDVDVPQTRFADATDEAGDRLARLLERELSGWNMTIALDRLLPDLTSGEEHNTTEGLEHNPPQILHSKEPAILVTIDGEPKLEAIEGADLERVVNSPFLIVRGEEPPLYYLSGGGDLWFASRNVAGPWEPSTDVPPAVAQLAPSTPEGETVEGPSPKIFVATEPTELIVSAGEPSWSPVEGMGLLYLDNSDSDVFLEISTQRYYVLLSGRWYRGRQIGDEWELEHVANDELPLAFAELDPDSVNGHVLTSVAGTEQAREAVLDNSVPQTAAIRRDDGSFQVRYDGEPAFENVEDLSIQYAVNTSMSVFRVEDAYYACEQGVWYLAPTATGPWIVATKVPDVLYRIPPSNPHYNVTYVHVYDVTPEVVYVGYTPGYLGSYYYHGCVVYGTGWYYNPWYGPHYYPRPFTWGFRVTYNPWTGWGFGVTWARGPFMFSIGTWGRGAWFGPIGFRPFPRPFVGVGFRKTNVNINVNVNRNVNINRGNRDAGNRGNNLYDRDTNRNRNADRPTTGNRQQSTTSRNAKNDVFTDRDGNVYRRDSGGNWQSRDQGQWKSAENLDRAGGSGGSGGGNRSRDAGNPSTTGRAATPNYQRSRQGAERPQLERDSYARQRGNQRTNNYQRSSAGRGTSRGRTGGGRRR